MAFGLSKHKKNKEAISACSYMPLYGPNTNQWWVYNETKDVYIDPPKSILHLINLTKPKSDGTRDFAEEERFFTRILKNKPSWLGDVEAQYAEVEI